MCYLSKNLQNTSHFVRLFSAHGDVVVGFAIFHIVIFQKRKKEKRKKKKGNKKRDMTRSALLGHPPHTRAGVCGAPYTPSWSVYRNNHEIPHERLSAVTTPNTP
jgi:hypothetical protein